MFWEYIKALIYGVIEGITEWLPVSSTGHLILLEGFFDFDIGGSAELSAEFCSMLDVVVQLGAILAVLCIYARPLLPTKQNKKSALSLWGSLVLCTIPAALIGLIADTLCQKLLGTELDSLLFEPRIVASALIIYGILFILIEKLTAEGYKDVTHKHALAIGFFQALAIVPGTSRSGATILGARVLGIPREKAARFSFYAAIPVISAASLLKICDFASFLKDTGEKLLPEAWIILLIASLTAFLTSLIAIKALTGFVKKHTFIPFGIYRILLGILVLLLIK